MLDDVVNDDEYLFRGVVKNNWDILNNRPSSAAFKGSTGVSVDRDGERNETDCIQGLLQNKPFFAICKVLTGDVRGLNAIVQYLPVEGNIYHSEIHNSLDEILLKGKKPSKIREMSTVVYQS